MTGLVFRPGFGGIRGSPVCQRATRERGHGHIAAQYPREDKYTEKETRDVVPFEPLFLVWRAEKAFSASEPVGTYAENESGKTHEHSEITCPVHELCP